MTSPFVEYDRWAPEYRRRRAARPETLTGWQEAVRRHLLQPGAPTVLDVGAGTGTFSHAWMTWGAARVVALEPSKAMLEQSTTTEQFHRVYGQAEAIPLTTRSADVVWVSTAFHHFVDKSAAVAEFGRVLTDEGCVMLRGFVPGHTTLEWLTLFPGHERAIARFPSLTETEQVFARQGFDLAHAAVIQEFTQTFRDRADFTERMRHADSILTALTDSEVETGLAALRARGDETETFDLSFLVFRRTR